MHSFTVSLAGEELHVLQSGALWWPDRRILAVSDLHLEKGSSYAAAGVLLPPYDSVATINRLAALIERMQPKCVVAMGDNFHDSGGDERLDPQAAHSLRALQSGRDWVWLAGNHDPDAQTALYDNAVDEWAEGPLVFRHEPRSGAAGEIAGHLHPKIRVKTRARTVSCRCFVTDGQRILMPAFGALTGGLDVRDPAIRGLFGKKAIGLAMGPSRVHPLAV